MKVTGETDLQHLLRGMAPEVVGCDWGYACATSLPAGVTPFATVAEDKGLTLIAPMEELAVAGLSPASLLPYRPAPGGELRSAVP